MFGANIYLWNLIYNRKHSILLNINTLSFRNSNQRCAQHVSWICCPPWFRWSGPPLQTIIINHHSSTRVLQDFPRVVLTWNIFLPQSWGWNLVDNHLLHNGDSQGNYPQLNNAPKYQVSIQCNAIYSQIANLKSTIYCAALTWCI